jgi:chromosome segregation ATPase
MASAKKAKTVPAETPLMNFLSKCDDIPKPCKEMLHTAVPLCLAVTEADRHKFQSEVLDFVGALLATEEGKRRDAISAVEAELKAAEEEKAQAGANDEAKKATAASKSSECEEKRKVVDAAQEASDAAQKTLKDAKAADAAFNGKKAGLLSEQTNFAKLLAEVFQPLKDAALKASGHKRNKIVAELKKKLVELGAQESLGEALVSISKMTPEKQKGSFAQVSLKFAEEFFTAHTAKVAKDIAGLDEEAAGIASALVAGEAKCTETKDALDVVTKERNEMSEVSSGLSAESRQASKSLKQIESRITKITRSLEKCQVDLTNFLDLSALFSKLKELSTAAPQELEEAGQEDNDAGEGEKVTEEVKPAEDEQMS